MTSAGELLTSDPKREKEPLLAASNKINWNVWHHVISLLLDLFTLHRIPFEKFSLLVSIRDSWAGFMHDNIFYFNAIIFFLVTKWHFAYGKVSTYLDLISLCKNKLSSKWLCVSYYVALLKSMKSIIWPKSKRLRILVNDHDQPK